MIPAIKHKKKAPKKSVISNELFERLNSNTDFAKLGYIYAVTSKKYAEGTIIEVTASRLKAQRKCFTKSKKVRKGYYTKFVFDSTVPVDVLASISKEINTK